MAEVIDVIAQKRDGVRATDGWYDAISTVLVDPTKTELAADIINKVAEGDRVAVRIGTHFECFIHLDQAGHMHNIRELLEVLYD